MERIELMEFNGTHREDTEFKGVCIGLDIQTPCSCGTCADSIEQNMVRHEEKARCVVRAYTSREPREMYGTKMNTEQTAHTSASHPPRSWTTSTSTSEGMTRSSDQTKNIWSRIFVRMCGVPAHSSVSISPFGTFHPMPFGRLAMSIITSTCA